MSSEPFESRVEDDVDPGDLMVVGTGLLPAKSDFYDSEEHKLRFAEGLKRDLIQLAKTDDNAEYLARAFANMVDNFGADVKDTEIDEAFAAIQSSKPTAPVNLSLLSDDDWLGVLSAFHGSVVAVEDEDDAAAAERRPDRQSDVGAFGPPTGGAAAEPAVQLGPVIEVSKLRQIHTTIAQQAVAGFTRPGVLGPVMSRKTMWYNTDDSTVFGSVAHFVAVNAAKDGGAVVSIYLVPHDPNVNAEGGRRLPGIGTFGPTAPKSGTMKDYGFFGNVSLGDDEQKEMASVLSKFQYFGIVTMYSDIPDVKVNGFSWMLALLAALWGGAANTVFTGVVDMQGLVNPGMADLQISEDFEVKAAIAASARKFIVGPAPPLLVSKYPDMPRMLTSPGSFSMGVSAYTIGEAMAASVMLENHPVFRAARLTQSETSKRMAAVYKSLSDDVPAVTAQYEAVKKSWLDYMAWANKQVPGTTFYPNPDKAMLNFRAWEESNISTVNGKRLLKSAEKIPGALSFIQAQTRALDQMKTSIQTKIANAKRSAEQAGAAKKQKESVNMSVVAAPTSGAPSKRTTGLMGLLQQYKPGLSV